MGLIRSKNTKLTPMSSDSDLTRYLWPIVCGIIKTAIENKQNLIVEGCYIPYDWSKDFEKVYLDNIAYCCLVMSEQYIKDHFNDIKGYANVIENRINDFCDLENVLEENAKILYNVQKHKLNHILIDDKYELDINSIFKQRI